MPNDSSTGGYLVPSSKNGTLEDQALDRFLQQLVVGITGLDGTLIRPRWQDEPPNIPELTVDWASIGEDSRSREAFSFVGHRVSGFGEGGFGEGGFGGDTGDLNLRQQELSLLAIFYGPNSRGFAEIFSMGLDIPQNQETMKINGYAFINAEGMVNTSEQIRSRWLRRADVRFYLRRVQGYTYPVLDLNGSTGTLVLDSKVTSQWSIKGS